MRQQFAWNFAAQAVGLVLPPLLLVILARLLDPSDFGVFALVLMILAALQTVTVSPLNEAIIKSEREDIGHFMFTAQLIIGCICAGLLYFLADSLATLFKKPELVAPLRISGLTFLIVPFVNSAISVSMRQISFKAVFIRKIVTPLANACVSIPMALSGMGYWALVWGQIAGFSVAGFVIIWVGAWKPRLNFNFKDSLEDFKFCGQMALQGFVRWTNSQSDTAILGYHVPFSELGKYDMAGKMASLPFLVLARPVAQVLYPIMSQRHRLGENIHDLYLMSQRRVLMLSAPIAVMIFINAEGIVLGVFGEAWMAVIPILAVLTVVGVATVMVSGNIEVFMAKGVPKTMTKFMFVRAMSTVPVFLWLAPKGIMAVSLGVLGLTLFFSPISVFLTTRLLGIKIKTYIYQVVKRPIIAMFAVALSNIALLQLPLGLLLGTFINLAVGGMIVLASVFYWERDVFKWRQE